MAFVIKDRVREDVSVSGTSGAVTLNGAITGFRTFSSTVSNSDTFYYTIVDQDTDDFEVGVGTYVSGTNTITRGTILSSSNSNNAVNFTGTNQEIFLTHPADKAVVLDTSDNLTLPSDLTVSGDLSVQGTTITIDSASAQTVDLGDNDKIRLGDGDDLQIYHDGSNSYVQENGIGNLYISGQNHIYLTNSDQTQTYAAFNGPTGWAKLYYSNNEKLATTSTGINVTGTVTADGLTVDGDVNLTGDLSFGDNDKAIFGAGSDLQIFHDGSDSRITDVGTGDLILGGNKVKLTDLTGTVKYVEGAAGSQAVTLFHASSAKLATASTGINVTGRIFADEAVEVESASGFGSLELGGPSGGYVDFKTPFSDDYDGRIIYDGGSFSFTTNVDQPIFLRHNNSTKLATTSTGIKVTGNVVPSADATHDLGTASLSWNNIYTNDLHLSNMKHEKGNDVDGTKGDWTIQEGAEDLFIINNRTGKKFKFSLQEVS